MPYALIIDGEAVEIASGHGFVDANGVQHPADWDTAWSPQQKVAKGLRLITEPAALADGYRRNGLSLSVVAGQPVRVADDEAIPLADLKAAKQQAIRARRQVAENAGVTVNGMALRTDEGTQAKVTGALLLFQINPELESLDWEATPGAFVTLDQPTLQAVGLALGAYVQACFTRSRELSEAVASAADAQALAAIDIDAGWPE